VKKNRCEEFGPSAVLVIGTVAEQKLYWVSVKVLYSIYTLVFLLIFVTETHSIRCLKSLLITSHSV